MQTPAVRSDFDIDTSDGIFDSQVILDSFVFLSTPAQGTVIVQSSDGRLHALEARDGAAAEQAMRSHIEAAHRTRLRQLRGSAE